MNVELILGRILFWGSAWFLASIVLVFVWAAACRGKSYVQCDICAKTADAKDDQYLPAGWSVIGEEGVGYAWSWGIACPECHANGNVDRLMGVLNDE